jgi:predicted dehydrogenase
MKMNRREFLIASALATAGVGLPSILRSHIPASDRVRVGIVGVKGRGARHIAEYLSLPGVDIVALCDTDRDALRNGEVMVSEALLERPALYSDWRRLIDQQDIDAISITLSQAARTEVAIAACMTGKDVLIERPATFLDDLTRLSHAAEASGRVVGQTYSPRFAGASDCRTEITTQSFDSINVARTSRTIPTTPIIPYGADGRDQDGLRRLLFAPIEEFDYAKAILGVGSPISVSCVSVQGIERGEITRAGSRFEFDSASGSKHIEIESIGVFSDLLDSSDEASTITFDGDRAAFSVRSDCNLIYGRHGWPSIWSNFLECVRSRRPLDLYAPISDLTASLKILQLAELSVISGRPVLRDQNSISKATR